jgi:hypothetical protein
VNHFPYCEDRILTLRFDVKAHLSSAGQKNFALRFRFPLHNEWGILSEGSIIFARENRDHAVKNGYGFMYLSVEPDFLWFLCYEQRRGSKIKRFSGIN